MGTQINLDTWARRETYHWFRAFEQPHYAITCRIDVSHLMKKRDQQNLSTFRSSLWAIGKGLYDVPALRLRFKGNVITQYETVNMSPPIDAGDGSFRYCYIHWEPDFSTFDERAQAIIEQTKSSTTLDAVTDQDDVAFLSCLPWLNYTSLDNALPGAEDCIPRISWGKIVPSQTGFDMAMTLQVHHALVDGRDVGHFFDATQSAFNAL